MNDPREHILEEPTNDFMDTAIGFGVMAGFMLVIAVAATVIKAMM